MSRSDAFAYLYRNRPMGPPANFAIRASLGSSSRGHIQVFIRMRRRTGDGDFNASGSPIGPPKSCTMRVKRSSSRRPTNSASVAACASGVYAKSTGRSDRPNPR